MLERNEMDTDVGIARAALVIAPTFLKIWDAKNPFAIVSQYRQDVEKLLENLDERMCKIVTELDDRTIWANRMRSCHKMLETISRNLEVRDKQCDLIEITSAMGILRAITQGAEQTLAMNE